MTSESSKPDEQVEADAELAWHREMDRHVEWWDDDGEVLPGLAALMNRQSVFEDEPTFEKWRRGQKWN